ncbi:MAG: adenosylcobinamide-phosphate synthase CbiB [Gammaproteobacteria bacterium]|nr:adenosylcobinamide-phosphate synthase CbiB [Gammaproteobacteria bacterium]MCW9088957.1 adenosylcobinamide-phosphate synthase CbiB [Gammaproteobacteria bacterium]
MTTAIVIIVAVLLDLWLGEPRQHHPLALFGRYAGRIEARLIGVSDAGQRLRGVSAVLLAILPWVVLSALLLFLPGVDLLVSVLLLYLAIGGSSLAQHGRAVAAALAEGNLDLARKRVGEIVSRETDTLDEEGVSRAAVESVLENGNDALFGTIFWFVLLGAPGVVLFRLSNTLDAMWGYKSERYHVFGWAAARLDDLLGWLPARLTALAYLLVGDTVRGWRCWRQQGGQSDSPNAGVVMASGAGALGVQLGGPAVYHGELCEKPLLGEGVPPQGADIARAISLVQRALILWLVAILIMGVVL